MEQGAGALFVVPALAGMDAVSWARLWQRIFRLKAVLRTPNIPNVRTQSTVNQESIFSASIDWNNVMRAKPDLRARGTLCLTPETRIEHRRKNYLEQVGRFAILRCPPGAKEFQLLAEIPSALRKRVRKNLVESDGYIYFGDRAPDFLYPEGTLDAEMGEAIYRLPLTFKTKKAKVKQTYN